MNSGQHSLRPMTAYSGIHALKEPQASERDPDQRRQNSPTSPSATGKTNLCFAGTEYFDYRLTKLFVSTDSVKVGASVDTYICPQP